MKIVTNGCLRVHDGTRTVRYRGKRYNVNQFVKIDSLDRTTYPPEPWTHFLRQSNTHGIVLQMPGKLRDTYVIGSYHIERK